MRIFQLQRLSAIGLLVFLTIHMIVVHYPPFHIDFSRIAERMANPLWKAIDIAFLFTVLIHALTGAYQVFTDFQGINRYRRVLAGIAIVLGVVGFIYGTITVLQFNPEAASEAASLLP
jgi:succinate dehydrogenase / fumarate reductase membrane anchor subunit